MKYFTVHLLVLAALTIVFLIAYAVYSDNSVSPYCPDSEVTAIDQKKIRKIFSPNQTSASFLVSYYRLETCKASGASDRLKRFSIVYDVYIKARS
ncbi:MAG: hypothetical protein ABFS02_09410 [Pseudomonadota bacterium]